jgi:hypothetical protein
MNLDPELEARMWTQTPDPISVSINLDSDSASKIWLEILDTDYCCQFSILNLELGMVNGNLASESVTII